MKINVLASGSSGNCVVIDDQIAIDAGYNSWVECDVLLLTHKHSDHTKYVNRFGGCEIYCTAAVQNDLQPKYPYLAFNVFDVGDTIVINGSIYNYIINTFALLHDAPCVGFDITRRPVDSSEDDVRILYATDFSQILPKAEKTIINNLRLKVYDEIYIECNNTLKPMDFHEIYFPENGVVPKDEFHRRRSYQNHCNVEYLIGLFERAGYTEDNKFTEPVTLMHKSTYYYMRRPEQLVRLMKIVNITNPFL